jgi:AraC-like DNA-binding protein
MNDIHKLREYTKVPEDLIQELIRKYVEEDVPLEDLAKEAGVARSTLTMRFRYRGVRPKPRGNYIRKKQAREKALQREEAKAKGEIPKKAKSDPKPKRKIIEVNT